MTLNFPESYSYSKNLFPNSDKAGLGVNNAGSATSYTDVGTGIVPIGGVVAWLKTFVDGTTAEVLIPNYLECDGSIIDDVDSPLDGFTLPNLNGSNNILQGHATTSGSTAVEPIVISSPNSTVDALSGGATNDVVWGLSAPANTVASNPNTLDSSDMVQMNVSGTSKLYTVVWVMRIK